MLTLSVACLQEIVVLSQGTDVEARGVTRKADWHEVNFEYGRDDFDNVSDGELNAPAKPREHVSSPRRFDQADEADGAMYVTSLTGCMLLVFDLSLIHI